MVVYDLVIWQLSDLRLRAYGPLCTFMLDLRQMKNPFSAFAAVKRDMQLLDTGPERPKRRLLGAKKIIS